MNSPRDLLLAILACFLAAGVQAGNETGKFWVARMTGYYGEVTNAVMSEAGCNRAVAEAFEANDVAVAAYDEFAETWRKEQQKANAPQKKGAKPKAPVDTSYQNIVLEKPGRKSVQISDPFASRKDAEAEKAAREAKVAEEQGRLQEAEGQYVAKPADSAKIANEDRRLLRSQQLALFLSIAEKRRLAYHNQKGLKSSNDHATRMQSNAKRLLTTNPPPLDRPSTNAPAATKADP